MGTRIEAAATMASHGIRRPSARRLADAAARACLAHAGRQASDVDLLINTGVYREDHLGEPPVGGHGTFSFDVANGTCGVISAIQLQAGLLRSGVINLGLIVTSDVNPNPKEPGSALIRPTGGALLLGRDDSIAGFTDFHAETFPEFESLLVSGLTWRPRRGLRVPGRAAGHSEMLLCEQPGYL